MWFGEFSLLKREPRPNNVVSDTAVDLLLLDRSDLTTILGPLQAILDAQAANFGPTSVKKVLHTSIWMTCKCEPTSKRQMMLSHICLIILEESIHYRFTCCMLHDNDHNSMSFQHLTAAASLEH